MHLQRAHLACQPTNPTVSNPTGFTYTTFVTKLSPDGSSLVYSSYLGGSGEVLNCPLVPPDQGTAIAVDAPNNVCIAGLTGSPDFPTTPGSFESAPPAGFSNSAFVTRIDLSGKSTPLVAITPANSSITSVQPLTLSITVTHGGCSAVPTGSITITSGNFTSSAAKLTNGSATLTIPAGSLAIGQDTLTATYSADTASSSNIASAMATVTVTVTGAGVAPSLTITPAVSTLTTAQSLSVTVAVSSGVGKPTPTGTVTLSATGYTSALTSLTAGAATLTLPAGSLPIGTDTYTPDSASAALYNPASSSANVTVTAGPVVFTVSTTPAGLAFSVDGTAYTTCQTLS